MNTIDAIRQAIEDDKAVELRLHKYIGRAVFIDGESAEQAEEVSISEIATLFEAFGVSAEYIVSGGGYLAVSFSRARRGAELWAVGDLWVAADKAKAELLSMSKAITENNNAGYVDDPVEESIFIGELVIEMQNALDKLALKNLKTPMEPRPIERPAVEIVSLLTRMAATLTVARGMAAGLVGYCPRDIDSMADQIYEMLDSLAKELFAFMEIENETTSD